MKRVISHYRLDEELGHGGMGTIYKAHDLTLDRTVVLKLLAPDLVLQESSRKRFLREARLASELDHANICTIYETAEVDNECLIAMQYIEGKTLKKVIGGKPLNLDSLFAIALQVADAVAVAHAKGIVHRDIKASNIMITPRGQAKVLDFGLAKLVHEKGAAGESESASGSDDLTKLGTPLGTPSYMSPEQARGERSDHRSDIYSFGVVLYEMATGRLPFRASTTVDMLHAVMHGTPRTANEVNARLPEKLVALINRAMARASGDRYQSMQRLLEDLRAIKASLRVSERGVPDGITVPFVEPKHIATNPLTRLWQSLFGRRRDGRAQASWPTQPSLARPRLTPPEISFAEGMKKTLAVLPFRNLSGDPNADFYSLSLADSLITELGNVQTINVLPSSAITRYQNQSVDPAQVRSELDADLMLTGNFLQAGGRLRVTAQLVDGRSGQILWSEKIDSDAQDVLAIQDRISQTIIAGLSKRQVSVDPTLLIKDENEAMRLDGVRSLEFSHDPRALSALLEALRDASLKVKAEAVRVIVKLGDEATGPVISLLNDAVDEGDYLTARFAAKALGLIGDRSISAVLVELLQCDDKFVACESALALGRLHEAKAVPDLIALLDDRNGNMRFAASDALGQICDARARDALQHRLSDEDEGVRAKARWALSRLRIADRAAQRSLTARI